MMVNTRWDMRLTDKEVLKAINKMTEPLTQTELAERLDCSEMTVRRAIGRLREKKFITQERSNRRVAARYEINKENLPDEVRSELQ